MEEILSYPVAVYYSDDDKVYYADIIFENQMYECATFGDTFEEAVSMAKDWIALSVSHDNSFSKEISIPNIKVYTKGPVVYLDIWLPYYHAKTRLVYKKLTVTVPNYLIGLGKEMNLNFSKILSDALKTELGIEDRPQARKLKKAG